MTIGTFSSEEKAARAWDAYVVEHKLERPLNFPVGADGRPPRKSKSKSQKKNKKDVNVVGGGSHGSNGGNSGLSVIADIGTALQMCEMISANSNSPVQSPTRPATPPTRKNETAAHVLAQSFVRISKEDDAVSALLDLL